MRNKMEIKLYDQIKNWYLENKSSAIAKSIGTFGLVGLLYFSFNAIDCKKEFKKMQKNPFVKEFIDTDIKLGKLENELKYNESYYLIHQNMKEKAKKISFSFKNKMKKIYDNNNIVQKYVKDIKSSCGRGGCNGIGFNYYHCSSKSSSKNWSFAILSGLVTLFGYFVGVIAKKEK